MDMHEFAMFCKSMDTAYGYDRADKKVYGAAGMKAFALLLTVCKKSVDFIMGLRRKICEG